MDILTVQRSAVGFMGIQRARRSSQAAQLDLWESNELMAHRVIAQLDLWESNELGTETESSSLAGGEANGGGKKVEDGEDSGGEESKCANLTEHKLLLRDDNRSDSNGKTLNEVLDNTCNNLAHKRIHFLYILQRKSSRDDLRIFGISMNRIGYHACSSHYREKCSGGFS
jgi:hypothetical protein